MRNTEYKHVRAADGQCSSRWWAQVILVAHGAQGHNGHSIHA